MPDVLFEAFLKQSHERVAARKVEARRAKISALAEHAGTEGERAAALSALGRLGTPSHAENDRMQRGGNFVEEP